MQYKNISLIAAVFAVLTWLYGARAKCARDVPDGVERAANDALVVLLLQLVQEDRHHLRSRASGHRLARRDSKKEISHRCEEFLGIF